MNGLLQHAKQKVRPVYIRAPGFILHTHRACLKNGGPSMGRTQVVFQQPAKGVTEQRRVPGGDVECFKGVRETLPAWPCLFGAGGPGKYPILALGGPFQHLFIDTLLLPGKCVANEIGKRRRRSSLGPALEREYGDDVDKGHSL